MKQQNDKGQTTIIDRDTKRETLDDSISRLVAEIDHVSPDKITTQYIQKRREETIYPKARYNVGSSYGGHNLTGLTSPTREEVNKISRIVSRIIQ